MGHLRWLVCSAVLFAYGCVQLPNDDGMLEPVDLTPGSYQDDIAAIRAILEANGRGGLDPASVVTMEGEYEGKFRVLAVKMAALQLTQVPPEVSKLTALLNLSLDSNQLMQLPAEIGQLRYLEVLNLHANRLLDLPRTMGGLRSLKTLDVSFNQLQAVPAELGELPNLSTLFLQENKLQTLPGSLVDKPSIQDLNVHFNEICTPSEPGLVNWLDSRDPGWETAQTCP